MKALAAVILKSKTIFFISPIEMEREVSLWVSYRYQPLARSVRGIMNNRTMYQFYANVNYPTLDSLINNEAESKQNKEDYDERRKAAEEKTL